MTCHVAFDRQRASRGRPLGGTPPSLSRICAALLAGASLLQCPVLPVAAQQARPEPQLEGTPFRESFGEYTLVYSAVRASALPEQSLRRHGATVGADAVLLNVTVQRGGDNVRARIDATATNLAGQSREVEMNETVANGLVSYVGVVEIAEQEVLDFELEVLPQDAAEPFRLEFRTGD